MGSLPDSQYIIQTDGYWFVEAHDVDPSKGYITVSAKGIVNGLSNQPNDGCDFGPDTYNPSYSGSGIPYTQTSGIQEAINFIFPTGGRIYLKKGVYNINTSPKLGVSNNYYLIGIPPSSEWQQIIIEGETSIAPGYSYAGNGTTNDLVYAGPTPDVGVQLKVHISLDQLSTTTDTNVLYCESNRNNLNHLSYLNVQYRNLRITIPPGLALNAFSLYNANSGDMFNCVADIDMTESDYPPNPAMAGGNTEGIIYSFCAFSFSNTLSNGGYGDRLYAVGYYTGIIAGDYGHVNFGMVYIQSCYVAVVWIASSGHSGVIKYINIQQTPYHFYNRSAGTARLNVEFLDAEENSGLSSTNKYYWTNQISNLYNETTGNFTGVIKYHKNASNTQLIGIAGQYGLKAINLDDANDPTLVSGSPTISTNPPASATAYQNTNPYDIRIYLPAYASTSGTAGTVAIALGSSSSPSTIGTRYISGSTSSSSTDILELVVPAGWYYEYTLTGVTLATATVVAA